jgi:hypothetical protein
LNSALRAPDDLFKLSVVVFRSFRSFRSSLGVWNGVPGEEA